MWYRCKLLTFLTVFDNEMICLLLILSLRLVAILSASVRDIRFEIKRRFFCATCDFIAATIAIGGASVSENFLRYGKNIKRVIIIRAKLRQNSEI